MGLDLYCGEEYARAGSYSIVHAQRNGLLRAYILYLRESTPSGTTEFDRALAKVENRRLANFLEKAVEEKKGVDYNIMAKLHDKIHPGVHAFIYHSDCDGVWMSHECRQILDALCRLRSYLSRIPEIYLDDAGNFYLHNILIHSVETGQDIRFS
jgi:hypothetical protein